MNTIQKFILSLSVAGSLFAPDALAAIGSADNTPAATLLIPHFEVDVTSAGSRTHFSVGNSSGTEQLAHVTLWTDYGVPTYSFDVRLPANGIVEVDLGDLFIQGTLPQSTAGSIPGCAGALPPAPLSATTLSALRNAHSGQASSLLGGQCGGSPTGQVRGYATVDVANSCSGSQSFPGDAGYFVAGGLGVAGNQNVLFGEYGTTNTTRALAFGETAVHIEASATDAQTDGAGDYTFYGRRVSASGADNRESLPSNFMARWVDQSVSNPNIPTQTRALIWRDPGVVAPFACGTRPAAMPGGRVVAFNHQEQVYLDRVAVSADRAAQVASVSGLPYTQGMLAYELGFNSGLFTTNQAWVSHVFTSVSSLSVAREEAQSNAQPLAFLPIGSSVLFAACNDGIDNDNDGRVDFPADPDCSSRFGQTESATQCNDGIDNDMDGFIDFPADQGCASRFSPTETTVCNDGVDNDMDGQIDFPLDIGCASGADIEESDAFSNECSDGLDNGQNGLTDFPDDPGCTGLFDPIEGLARCSDGRDNDNDGLIDFPADPGCSSQFDPDETNAACSDGIDNDMDGFTDFPADNGCLGPTDFSELPSLCHDGIDNDADGLVDFPADPGCQSLSSNIENPQCNDGTDNDMDGDTDFPADQGCTAAFGGSEATACDDGLDNDGDMLIDFPNDPGCASPTSNTERPECNDAFDNDGDTFVDFPQDPQCSSASSRFETGDQCQDGLDNDGDGLTDFPASPYCSSSLDGVEAPACSDGADNDADGLTDFPTDPGCESTLDNSELVGVTQTGCSDGIDNDADGLIDFPADPGCLSANDDIEFLDGQAVGINARPIPVAGAPGLALMILLLMGIGLVAFRSRSQG